MAVLNTPDKKQSITEFGAIKKFLDVRGILIEPWAASAEFSADAAQDEILHAYRPTLKPYMEKHGYQVADVIAVHPETPNLDALKEKFLREHTHSEDEVRFFVEGKGYFWFNHNDEIFCVTCEAGDLMSVPKGYKHWFDMGEKPFVKVIRIFIDPAGWVPEYTDSDVEQRYEPVYKASVS